VDNTRCPQCHNWLNPHCKRTVKHGKPVARPCGWGECKQCKQVYRLADMRAMPERGSEVNG
jgi:RNase P subunit RPR2